MNDDERRVYERLGQEVQAARIAAGWRQEDLAYYCDLSRSSIANLEAGRQAVSAYTLLRIHGVLGLQFEGLKPTRQAIELIDRNALIAENRRLHAKLGRIRAAMNS